MVDLQRRALLLGAAATVAALRVGAAALAAPIRRMPLGADPFTLGVASGDPAADGFVLWTRLAPDPLNGGGMDVRQYRDPPPCGGGITDCPERLGADRTLLGADQEAHATLGDVTSPRIGTELVGTSVSSRFDPVLLDAAEALIGALPYVEYANARQRGYTVVDVSRSELVATFKVVSTIDTRPASVSVAHVAEVAARTAGFAPPATPVAGTPAFTG